VSSSLLVALSGEVVLLLVLLVTESVDGGVSAGAQGSVGVLGDLLVALLGSFGGGTWERRR
jgi:hypothetical protein